MLDGTTDAGHLRGDVMFRSLTCLSRMSLARYPDPDSPMCTCAQLPRVLPGDDAHPPVDRLKQVARKKNTWARLYQCEACGQYWQVDVWNKYSKGLAIKMKDPDAWKTYDDKPDRLQYIIDARGGTTETPCMWRNCEAPSLKGLVYCPEHAYTIVGLRA